MTAALAGLGRALGEVGAIIVVGGNINHVTRVMTTTIALEPSKGNLALALGLGIILVGLSILVNGLVMALRSSAARLAYARLAAPARPAPQRCGGSPGRGARTRR